MTRRFTPGKIVIHCPQDFADYWGQDSTSQIKDIFSGVNNNLLILNNVSPGDYTPVSEGEGVSLKTGWTESRAIALSKRLGFRFRVRDLRQDLRIALEELMESHVDSKCETASPIIIDDYCYPITREDRARGYRIREGFFTASLSGGRGNIIAGSRATCSSPMTIGDNYDRYNASFEIKFMEISQTKFY